MTRFLAPDLQARPLAQSPAAEACAANRASASGGGSGGRPGGIAAELRR